MAEGEAVIAESVAERRTVIDRGVAEQRVAAANPTALAAGVVADLTSLVAALRDRTDADLLPFYGMEVPPSIVAGMAVGELLVHGRDLAVAHGVANRHELPSAAAYEAILAAMSLVDHALTTAGREATASYGYRPTGHPSVTVHLVSGLPTVTHDRGGPVDAWFAGAAGTLLLATHGRLSSGRSLRTLRPSRRPWRALTLDRLFEPS
jgi:hypothetical protein